MVNLAYIVSEQLYNSSYDVSRRFDATHYDLRRINFKNYKIKLKSVFNFLLNNKKSPNSSTYFCSEKWEIFSVQRSTLVLS